MNSEFSFYFKYQRITNCDPVYLQELYAGEPDAEGIIEGILRDKERFDAEQAKSGS